MNTPTFFTVIAFLCVLLAYPQPAGFTDDAESGADVEFTITVSKHAVVVGEPVYITSTLTNTGAEDLMVLPTLHIYKNRDLEVYIQRAEEDRASERANAKCIKPNFIICAKGGPTLRLAPRQSVFPHIGLLAFDSNDGKYLFPQPGKYRLWVLCRYDFHRKPAKSNEVDITVIDPVGEEEQSFALWNADKNIVALLQEVSGGTLTKKNIASIREQVEREPTRPFVASVFLDTIKRMKMLVGKYPKSVYSQYAREALVRLGELEPEVGNIQQPPTGDKPQEAQQSTDWFVPGLIIACIALASIVVFLLLRRKRLGAR